MARIPPDPLRGNSFLRDVRIRSDGRFFRFTNVSNYGILILESDLILFFIQSIDEKLV